MLNRTVQLLLQNGCEFSRGVLVEDRDTDCTGYWTELHLEPNALDQEDGTQCIEIVMTVEEYQRYASFYNFPLPIHHHIQGKFDRVDPVPFTHSMVVVEMENV